MKNETMKKSISKLYGSLLVPFNKNTGECEIYGDIKDPIITFRYTIDELYHDLIIDLDDKPNEWIIWLQSYYVPNNNQEEYFVIEQTKTTISNTCNLWELKTAIKQLFKNSLKKSLEKPENLKYYKNLKK